MTTTKETVLAYLRAIESHDVEAVGRWLHPEVELLEHPNRLDPKGRRLDAAGMRADGERGAAVMAQEIYEVRGMLVDGARASVQIAWTGVLRDGREMTAQICSVIELRDGKVWRQEQYDCFPG